MGQTRKNLLSDRSRYFSKIKLDNQVLMFIISHMKVKKKNQKGVIYDNRLT
mgnify:FL=1|jgi:hypothetical protein